LLVRWLVKERKQARDGYRGRDATGTGAWRTGQLGQGRRERRRGGITASGREEEMRREEREQTEARERAITRPAAPPPKQHPPPAVLPAAALLVLLVQRTPPRPATRGPHRGPAYAAASALATGARAVERIFMVTHPWSHGCERTAPALHRVREQIVIVCLPKGRCRRGRPWPACVPTTCPNITPTRPLQFRRHPRSQHSPSFAKWAHRGPLVKPAKSEALGPK
ncbi:uncharacterized protein C8Q71DRAFT_883193, partial [Rhodofomes roseus]